MSSISDVTNGQDELDAAKLKPWWEIGVAYCMQLLFAYCFIAMFLIDSHGIQAKCIPKDVNATPFYKRKEFVDSTCFYQLIGGVTYPGAMGIFLVCAAYALDRMWTTTRAVRNAFHSLARIERLLYENKITEEDLSTHPDEVKPEREGPTIKYAKKYLDLHIDFTGTSLPVIYIIAMILRSFGYVVAVYFIVDNYLTFAARRMRSFHCIIDIPYYGVEEKFYCSSYIGMMGYSCGFFLIFITSVIFFCSVYGAGVAISIYRSCTCCFWKPPKDDIRTPECPNLLFIKKFCESSTTVSPGMMELINQVAWKQMKTVQRLVITASAGDDSTDDKESIL